MGATVIRDLPASGAPLPRARGREAAAHPRSARWGQLCVCDLVAKVGVSQPLLSFHLRILREAGLVSDRRAGRRVHYSLVPQGVGELEGAAAALGQVTHGGGVSCEGACCCE